MNYTQDDILYTTDTENNTAEVYYYSGSDSTVTVPESITVEGVTYSVTSIASYAFQNCHSITSITLPESLTSIGRAAFQNCTSLESIAIPDSVTYIGNYAFQNCTSLKNASLPSAITELNSDLFAYCESLTDVTIPASVTYISSAVFKYTAIESITIPEGVTTILDDEFLGCSNLKSATLPSTLTSVGYDLFADCVNLTTVDIPEGITNLGSYTFYGCTSLKNVTLPSTLTDIEYGMFYNCTSLTELTIPASVTYIGSYAFAYCTGLTEITLPAGVTQIDGNPFIGCTNLTVTIDESNTSYSITDDTLLSSDGTVLLAYFGDASEYTVPDGVTSIESGAFYECTSLTSITLPASLVYIGSSAFESCTSLTALTIPEGVTDIEYYAFSDDTNLVSITLPDSLAYLGNGAFSGCTSLKSIVIPDGIDGLYDGVFYGCSSLESVTLPDSLTYIGGSAFESCTSLTELTIPEGVTDIEYYAFANDTALVSITLPETLNYLGSGAFWNCTGLTSITIPYGVYGLYSYLFYGCSALTTISLPSSIEWIDYNAFYGCDSLTTVNYDGTEDSWNNNVYIEEGNDAITNADITYATSEWYIQDGVLYITGSGSMPDYSEDDDNRAPWYDSYDQFTSVVIEDGVTSIGDYAFDGSWSLESITINASIKRIGDKAFRGSAITSITIPDTVKTINSYAFQSCYGLTSLNIPASVTDIRSYALCDMGNLETITVDSESTSYVAEDNILYNYNKSEILLCPMQNPIGDYTVPETVNYIYEEAFAGTSITTLTVPDSISDISIGDWAFSGCENLTAAYIYGGQKYNVIRDNAFTNDYNLEEVVITNIGRLDDAAFYNCTGLTSVTLSANTYNIGQDAFWNCGSLKNITYLGDDWDNIYIGSGNDDLINAYNSVDISFTFADGTLTIFTTEEGKSGPMPTYSSCEETPWYEYKDEITSVIIKDGVTSVGNHAFDCVYNLASVSLPDGLTSLGDWSFSFCTALTEIALPDTLTSIGNNCFESCENLASIALPASLSSMGDWPFVSCNSLSSLTVDSENTVYSAQDNVLYRDNMTQLMFTATANPVTNIVIPDSVTEIWGGAFRWSTLESVTIPDGIENIWNETFSGCGNLTTITIPASVTFIGDSAFSDCWSLSNVIYNGDNWDGITIEDNNSSLTDAYEYTNSVSELVYTFEDGVLTISLADGTGGIGWMPVYSEAPWSEYIDSITSIVISEGITRIGLNAFNGYSQLTSVTIPTSVTAIKEYAFDCCENLSTVYYGGTEADWENISIDGGNDYLHNAYNNSLTAQDFDWSISEDGVLTVSGTGRMPTYDQWAAPWYDQRDSIYSIVVAEGLTSISSYAFCDLYNVTSVSLPSTLRNIYDECFNSCSNLTEIDIPESVVNIGQWAFCDCSSLTSVTIPAATTNIGCCAFGGCTSLPEIVVSEGNTAYCTVDGVLFSSDMGTLHSYPAGKAAQDYEVPDTVGYIMNMAFYKANVQNITLPEGLWGIEDGAFSNSTVTSINIPASLNNVANNSLNNILSNCYCLESITVAEDNELFSSEDGIAFNKDKTQLVLYPRAKSDITEYTVPDSVTSIGSYAVCNPYLTTITLTENVTEIKDGAFSGCTSLTDFTIPSGVTVIEDCTFQDCESLTSFTIPENITSIGSNAFNNCYGLQSVTIPDSVTTIYGSAFPRCTSLKEVTIPDSVTYLGDCAFENCTALETAYISSNVTEIYWNTFNGCTSLTTVTIPAGVTFIQDSAFNECQSLTTVNYGGTEADWDSINIEGNNDYLINAYENSTVAEIEWNIDDNGVLTISGTGKMPNYEDADENRAPWYDDRESITAIVINDGITRIGNNAFDYLSNVESVSIPDTVTKIGSCAFRYCNSLKSITLPESLTTIGDYAFDDCSSLTEITIPANVYSLGFCVFGGSSLTNIFVDENNESYCSVDGILYSKDMTELICCPPTNAATTLNIPDTVTNIWGSALQRCNNLREVYIPTSVTCIPVTAFNGCHYLRNVSMPASITEIYWGAFGDCPNLLNVYYDGTEEQWNSIYIEDENSALTNAYKYTTGYAANGAADLSYTIVDGVLTISGNGWMPNYGASWGWMDENDTTYRPEWYASRDEITSIVIEDGITRIGNFAFQYLTNVTSVTIADSVTEIGYQAFQFCSSLETITLSSSLTYVQAYAFSGCENLSTVTCSSEVWNNITFEEDGNGNEQIINAYANTNLKWNISDGVLTIYTDLSEGIAMPDYDSDSNRAPWADSYDSVTSIVIESGITSIGNNAFENSWSVESVSIPDTVTSIGEGAFRGSGITSITIPDSVTSIDGWAFQGSNITSIVIPENLTSIADGAFDNCQSLETITVADGNTSFCSDENGIVYTADMTEIVFCGCANTKVVNLVIPDTVTRVRSNVFNENNIIQTVTVAERTSDLVIGGFLNCDNLVSADLTGVTEIDGGAFYNSPSLTTVTLSASLTYVGESAFENCGSLTIVNYDGSEDDWSNINIESGNDALITAYYSTPVIAAAMADTQIGTIAAPTTMTNAATEQSVQYSDVVSESDTVTTLYIKIDKVEPTAAPTVTLADGTIAQASNVDYNSLGASCYYIYQFVNMDLTGATVTYGGVSTPVETSDATE